MPNPKENDENPKIIPAFVTLCPKHQNTPKAKQIRIKGKVLALAFGHSEEYYQNLALRLVGFTIF